MNHRWHRPVALCLILTAGILITGCEDDGPTEVIPDLAFVGMQACAECHSTIVDAVEASGHPWKLNKVVNGQAPTLPGWSSPVPPTGYTWDDITYVIGGFHWKARFVDSNGYIITGTTVQYNIETDGWVGYHDTEAPGTKSYDCGRCHTTGWVTFEEGGVRQDNLPGMAGAFSEPGVRCEQCHGKGSRHVETQSADDISVDTHSSLCGECHYRNANHLIDAKGGFIRHHEQYDEMLAAGHRGLECITCHDPHRSAVDGATMGAIKVECSSCHATQAATVNHAVTNCTVCHMPEATKSAVAENVYNGDVKTHIFAINTAAAGKDSLMWYSSGGKANGFVTLDFACYGCHKDPNGVGGNNSTKTLAELSAKAMTIHSGSQ